MRSEQEIKEEIDSYKNTLWRSGVREYVKALKWVLSGNDVGNVAKPNAQWEEGMKLSDERIKEKCDSIRANCGHNEAMYFRHGAEWARGIFQKSEKPVASDAVLAEVRAIILEELCFYDDEDIKNDNSMISKNFKAGYNSALKDVLTKFSEHFS